MRESKETNQKALSNDYSESQEQIPASEFNEITKLFALFAVEYPFFLPEHDSDLLARTNIWAKLLRPYGSHDRQIALEKCFIQHKKSGGPSVGDFLDILKSIHPRKELLELPSPIADPIFARKMFDEAKAILRGEL